MCKVTDFKINNINENCGWKPYMAFLQQAAKYSEKSDDYDDTDVLFMQQIQSYYKSIKLDPEYDTMAMNRTFPEEILRKACGVSAKLHAHYNTPESKVFKENMDFAYRALFNELPSFTVTRRP